MKDRREIKGRIPIRTLVIDDDASLCRKIFAWLQAAAYDVVTFTRPQEGIQHAARVPCEFALVDLQLADADGVGLITAIRRVSPPTRILAMAAFPDAKQILAAVRAGARDLLEKPIQQHTLLETLDRHLADLGIPLRTESEFNRRLGARLRALRQEVSQTLSDVCEMSGITAAQLSQIERGKSATSTWTLARICSALKTPMAKLFHDL